MFLNKVVNGIHKRCLASNVFYAASVHESYNKKHICGESNLLLGIGRNANTFDYAEKSD